MQEARAAAGNKRLPATGNRLQHCALTFWHMNSLASNLRNTRTDVLLANNYVVFKKNIVM